MGIQRYDVELSGTAYTWNGQRWFETKTFIEPPVTVVSKLNLLIKTKLAEEDAQIHNVGDLLTRAQIARDNQQFDRAYFLLKRALILRPGHEGALSILCSTLRKQNAPERAITETEELNNVDYAPLHTSRAAAMCDLGMWEEAKKEVGIALAIGGGREAAFAVVNRIKAARPDLYEK